MAKNSYIIRVYDQSVSADISGHADIVTGTVENADTGIKHAFHNKNELWKFVTEYEEKVLDKPVRNK